MKYDVDDREENIEKKLIEELYKSHDRDIRSGYTNIGPHRDDIEIFVNSMPIKIYGSQGQQRSAVLTMKLAESLILYDMTDEVPLVLLDDVMS